MLFKKILSVISALAICMPLFCFNVSAATSGNAVRTAKELMNMGPGGNYYLAADIDLSNVTWKPIGGFSGTFDGNGHKITGLTSETYGLFSILNSGAKIKNVTLENVYITSKYQYAGAVAAVIQSNAKNVSISGCYVSGLVASCRTKYRQKTSESTAGSIVAVNNSSSAVISDCYSNAVVASERVAGGLVGTNRGVLKDSGFGGQLANSYMVYELGSDYETGIKTELWLRSYAVGGLCGFNYGKVSNSFSNCTRVDLASYCGGIVGALQGSGTVSYCVNSSVVPYGAVDVYDINEFVGLIAGTAGSKTSVTNCYTRYSPDNGNTAQSDIGKTYISSVTYGVRENNYSKLSSFPKLDNDWIISGGVPVLKKLASYTNDVPIWAVSGERLVYNQSVPEIWDDDEESVDYGFDAEGNILE